MAHSIIRFGTKILVSTLTTTAFGKKFSTKLFLWVLFGIFGR